MRVTCGLAAVVRAFPNSHFPCEPTCTVIIFHSFFGCVALFLSHCDVIFVLRLFTGVTGLTAQSLSLSFYGEVK